MQVTTMDNDRLRHIPVTVIPIHEVTMLTLAPPMAGHAARHVKIPSEAVELSRFKQNSTRFELVKRVTSRNMAEDLTVINGSALAKHLARIIHERPGLLARRCQSGRPG